MSLIERAIQALKAQLRSKRHDAIDPKYKIVPDDLMTIPMTRRNTTHRGRGVSQVQHCPECDLPLPLNIPGQLQHICKGKKS